MVLLWSLPVLATPSVRPPSQIQVARQFLLAVLGGKFPAAYALLAPEVSRAVTPQRFRAAALPLYEQGRRHGATIDLYKLGYRISDDNTMRSFVAFTFRSDTLAKVPQVQMDVTFRDSTARQILSFGLVPAPQRRK
jgi:hypothetical protein